MTATGGGDTCEDVAGALKVASGAQMGWSRSNRCVIHFLDAPPHGSSYHDLGAGGDNHLGVGEGLTETLRCGPQARLWALLVEAV